MNKFLYIFLFFAQIVVAQTRPDQAPLVINPDINTWEFYDQHAGHPIQRTTGTALLKNGFGATVQATPIAYTPSTTANPVNDRNKIVKTTSGEVFFIDANGNAQSLGSSTESGTSESFYNRVGATIASGYPFPATTKKYKILRGGVSLTLANDFTISGNIVTFIVPLEDETVQIIVSSSFIN